MAYHVSLEQFEGPLDLLLHLIGAARVDIREIFVSSIVEQYLDTVAHAQKGPSDEDRSEFLVLASQLLEMKSRRLFRDPERQDEPEPDEERLYEQLEQYRLYREKAESLRERFEAASGVFARLPEEWVGGKTFQVKDVTLEALLEAFLRVRQQAQEEPEEPESIAREAVSLQSRILWIRRLFRSRDRLSFQGLLRGMNRAEAVTLFLAVLELIHTEEITARQAAPMAEIILERRKPEPEADLGDQ